MGPSQEPALAVLLLRNTPGPSPVISKGTTETAVHLFCLSLITGPTVCLKQKPPHTPVKVRVATAGLWPIPCHRKCLHSGHAQQASPEMLLRVTCISRVQKAESGKHRACHTVCRMPWYPEPQRRPLHLQSGAGLRAGRFQNLPPVLCLFLAHFGGGGYPGHPVWGLVAEMGGQVRAQGLWQLCGPAAASHHSA